MPCFLVLLSSSSDPLFPTLAFELGRRLIPGASFRNTGEILELAGCDYLTISPALLDELQKTEGQVPKKLDANAARDPSVKKVSYINNESEFRYLPAFLSLPPSLPSSSSLPLLLSSLTL